MGLISFEKIRYYAKRGRPKLRFWKVLFLYPKRYDIKTQEAPTLLLKGQGGLDGSSAGYKSIEFTFDKKIDVFFTDSIDYQSISYEVENGLYNGRSNSGI